MMTATSGAAQAGGNTLATANPYGATTNPMGATSNPMGTVNPLATATTTPGLEETTASSSAGAKGGGGSWGLLGLLGLLGLIGLRGSSRVT